MQRYLPGREITIDIGIRAATVRPRVHDLRHSFAVDTLIRWPRSGVNLDEHIGALRTYLGHPARQTPTVICPPLRADGPRRRPAPLAVGSRAVSPPAPVLQTYFTDRLLLLLGYVAKRTRKAPGTLDIADLDAGR